MTDREPISEENPMTTDYLSPTDTKDLTDPAQALDDLACFLEVLDPDDDGYEGRRHAAWTVALSEGIDALEQAARRRPSQTL